jgi:hypothetical protein
MGSAPLRAAPTGSCPRRLALRDDGCVLKPALVIAVSFGLALALAPGSAGTGTPVAAGGWQAVPDGPLSPRESALGLWTGSEVLVLGGSDSDPCPPNASCVATNDPPLADGAAYDPAARTWRRIARAPAGFEFATGAVVRGRAYVLGDNAEGRRGPARVFLRYRIAVDRWRRLAPPARDKRVSYRLVAAGDHVVAVGGGHGHAPLRVLERGRWRSLPRDGLGRSNGRAAAWSGDELVSFACGPSDGNSPCLTRAAAFSFATRTWRRLPDSAIQMLVGVWMSGGAGRLVNPTLGASDGGGTNGWGRSYPNGGILDVAAGTWSPLPDAPSENDWEGTGVLTADGATYGAAGGYVLDMTSARWLRIPRLPYVQARTVVAAGRDLFLFGGARFKRGNGMLLATATTWSPG